MLLSADTASGGSIKPDFTFELARLAVGGFGGEQVDYLALWNLEESQSAYRLDFGAAGSSMSLDRFYVDTFTQDSPFASVTAIPEPSSFVAMSVAAMLAYAGIGLWRRRQQVKAA